MANNIFKSIFVDIKPINEKNSKALFDTLKNIGNTAKDSQKLVSQLSKTFDNLGVSLSTKSKMHIDNLIKENVQIKNQLQAVKALDIAIGGLKKKIKIQGPNANEDDVALLRELEGKRSNLLSKKGVSAAYSKDLLANNPALGFLQKQLISLGKSFIDLAKGISEKLVPSFDRLMKGTTDLVTKMLDLKTGIANFNAATSLYTNASARESQIKYGLSISQNYGFMKAKEMLNISDNDDDLMYMNSAQRDEFLKIMQKQTAFYEKMNSSGVLQQIQRLQMDFEELKMEFANEIVTFIANNKELILGALRAIFTITKALMTVVNWIGNIFRTSPSAYEVENINSGSNSKTTIVNVKASNTNNATTNGSVNFANMSDAYWQNLGRQISEAIE